MPSMRYEILIPLRYNEGSEVESQKILQIRRDLTQRFGAITLEPQPLQGIWIHQGREYEDELIKFVVDVQENSDQIMQFFREYKGVLKQRFQQIDIWITAYEIQVV